MCGRAVQTTNTLHQAANSFIPRKEKNNDGFNESKLNASPGQNLHILYLSTQHESDVKKQHVQQSPPIITCTPLTWGLITRGGTANVPLPLGPSKHFSALMFNARAETVLEKMSFNRLLRERKTCVVPLEGFYEWKYLSREIVGGGGVPGKQPYFVHRKDGRPLYVAGLHTSVLTGRKIEDTDEKEVLRTFTMLTTAACKKLQWLHTRMPVIIWDETLITKWLSSSTPEKIVPELISQASSHSFPPELTWHPVTKRMSRTDYVGEDCIHAVKLEKIPSLTNYFAAPRKRKVGEEKEDAATMMAISSAEKRIKVKHETKVTKSGITSYFQPKTR